MNNQRKKISTKELRKVVREIIDKKISEYDALVNKEKEWEQAKEDLKSDMQDLLSNIEKDNYQQSVDQIDNVIKQLNGWKKKIEKQL